jgi:hypothetical protein
MRRIMRIGYEIEFFSRRNKIELLADYKTLGLDVFTNPTPNEFNWYLHGDGSLERSRPGDNAFELSSAIMPIRRGFSNMKKLFDDMVSHNDATNKSTGFHVSLSFADQALTKKMNIPVLIFLLDEEKVLRQFDRLNNYYCKPYRQELRETYSYIKRGRTMNNRTTPPIQLNELQSRISPTKYRFINLHKLELPVPYLEFRGVGGTDYHTRFLEIREVASHFMDCMKRSIDPNPTTLRTANKNFDAWASLIR